MSGASLARSSPASLASRRFCHELALRRRQMLVGEQLKARLERGVALLEPGDLRARPDDAPVRLDGDGLVGRSGKRSGAAGKLADQHLRRGMARGLAVDAVARCVGGEAEAVEPAYIMVLDQNLPVGANLCHDLLLVAQAPHQHAGAPVDETLRQALM